MSPLGSGPGVRGEPGQGAGGSEVRAGQFHAKGGYGYCGSPVQKSRSHLPDSFESSKFRTKLGYFVICERVKGRPGRVRWVWSPKDGSKYGLAKKIVSGVWEGETRFPPVLGVLDVTVRSVMMFEEFWASRCALS